MQVQSHTYIGTLMSWKWSTITTYTVHTYHIEPGTALPVRSCTSPSHSWCLHRDETCPVSHSSAGSPAWMLARTMCRTVVKEYNTEMTAAYSDNRQKNVHFSRLSPVTSLSQPHLTKWCMFISLYQKLFLKGEQAKKEKLGNRKACL